MKELLSSNAKLPLLKECSSLQCDVEMNYDIIRPLSTPGWKSPSFYCKILLIKRVHIDISQKYYYLLLIYFLSFPLSQNSSYLCLILFAYLQSSLLLTFQILAIWETHALCLIFPQGPHVKGLVGIWLVWGMGWLHKYFKLTTVLIQGDQFLVDSYLHDFIQGM